MKSLAVLLAFCLLAGASTATDPVPYKECEGAADISCSAYATLNILTTGGTCKGSVKADCAAVGASQSKYVEAYDDWWGGGDLDKICDSNTINVAANAVATAIAEVWTSAKAQVSCDGYGTACGYSISNGNAYAVGIAEALAQAAAEVVAGSQAEAFCYADVRAVSVAIAKAAGTANAEACVTDAGTNEEWKESYIQAVVTALADAFASASASACAEKGGDEATASSLCKGETTSTTTEDVVGLGEVCGGVSQVKACVGKGAETCCSEGRSFCRCDDCNGPWLKSSKSGDAKLIYVDQDKTPCFCLDGGSPPEVPSEPVEPTQPPEPTEPAEPTEPEEPTEPTEPEEPTEPTEPEEPTEPTEPEEPTEPTEPDESCAGAPDTSCSAFAILQILTTGGTCSGTASASCEAVTSSQSDFKEAYEEWWSEDGAECDSGKAEAAAKAIGIATASVWTEAAVKVKCEGEGFACGWSASGGNAWAIAFAEAIAQAAAEAVDPHGAADAFCFADIRAVSGAIAAAAADAQADACTKNQEASDFEEGLAVSISQAIADAFASATAQACSEEGEARASSKCEGQGTSTVDTDSLAVGNACAGISVPQVVACKGPGKDMCCEGSFQRTICACMSKGCENGPWIKQTKEDPSTNTLRSLRDTKGSVCFCT